MGRTYKRNSGFKKDRKDKSFKESKKFKKWNSTPKKDSTLDNKMVDYDGMDNIDP